MPVVLAGASGAPDDGGTVVDAEEEVVAGRERYQQRSGGCGARKLRA